MLNSSSRRGAFITLSFVVGLAVTLFFATMMFLLWRREVGSNYTVRQLGISPDFLTATWVDQDHWMWIERGGERIGAYHMAVRLIESTSEFELLARAQMQLNAFNMTLPLAIDLDVDMNRRFEMEDFRGMLKLGPQRLDAQAFVEGGHLYYRIAGPEQFIAGGGTASVMALDHPVMLQDAVRPIVTQSGRLEVGNRWTTRASDPIVGRFDIAIQVEVIDVETIELDGEPVEAYRVIETAEGNTVTSWYDSEGNLLKSDLGNGLVLTRTTRDEVLEEFPSFRMPAAFPQIDRAAIIDEAEAAAGESESPGQQTLPWLPNL